MATTAFNRSNILDDTERAEAARRCLRILEEADEDEMKDNDYAFYIDQMAWSNRTGYAPSERQLAWLRDMVERYCT